MFDHDLETEKAAAKRSIGLVPQEFNFNLFLPAVEVVVNQAGYYGIPRREGYRRAVPSPRPIGIINEKVVETLARQGTIVIASGGGGVPVYRDADGRLRPSEAVIDKDLASSLLGARIGANEFYILTDVPFVYINYGTPEQEVKEFLNYQDTVKYLEQGMFGKLIVE